MMDAGRATDIRSGIQIEVITVIWMLIEMAVSIVAGIAAGSILLTAFGLDSLIEMGGGGRIFWGGFVEKRGGVIAPRGEHGREGEGGGGHRRFPPYRCLVHSRVYGLRVHF